MFSHTFCLLICRLNANTTYWICMKISRNIVNGPNSNNSVLVEIWVIVCVQETPHHFLQIFRPLRMFKIVFRDSSLYPKQLSVFCLLWLNIASADGIGYTTSFCSMIKLLHELKNSSCWHRSIPAFDNVSAGKRELKFCWISIHNKKSKVFLRAVCAFSILV